MPSTLSRPNVIIAGIWAISLLSALISSQSSASVPFHSLRMAVILLAIPILSLCAVAVFGPSRSPVYHPKLSRFIDSRYGRHTFETFLIRLKPELLLAVVSILQGAFRLWRDYWNGVPYDLFPGMTVSSGLGFILMYSILYRRRAIGVYPLSKEESSSKQIAHTQVRASLAQSLRTYWGTLVGIAILPAAMWIAQKHFSVEIALALFVGVGFIAVRPVLSGRAPYSFWYVAMGLYVAGWMVTDFFKRS